MIVNEVQTRNGFIRPVASESDPTTRGIRQRRLHPQMDSGHCAPPRPDATHPTKRLLAAELHLRDAKGAAPCILRQGPPHRVDVRLDQSFPNRKLPTATSATVPMDGQRLTLTGSHSPSSAAPKWRGIPPKRGAQFSKPVSLWHSYINLLRDHRSDDWGCCFRDAG